MSYVRCLRGLGSGVCYSPDAVMNVCPSDGRPVEMVLDVDRIRDEYPNCGWYHPGRPDMWRFGALLPLDITDPEDRAHVVTLGEGYTPVYEYNDQPAARSAGFRLEVKDEGCPAPGFGHNPTLSFKDRGMAVVASMAHRLGLRRLACPTQGNAGDALVAYGVAAGLEVVIVMPADTPVPIMGRVAAMAKLHAGVRLDLVEGTIREASALVAERYLPEGYFNVATFHEPGWRIEGKKTLGLELAEPRRPGGPWQLPDVILYPTGGGTGIVGMWKAFHELETLGLIDDRRPRMVCVQSDRTAPLVHAFQAGKDDCEAVVPGQTIAAGLNVAAGIGHFRVLEILRASDGYALSVSDDEILTAMGEAFRKKGWWICPEGAACLAALPSLVNLGVIRRGDHVAAFNTASLEKYLPAVRHVL